MLCTHVQYSSSHLLFGLLLAMVVPTVCVCWVVWVPKSAELMMNTMNTQIWVKTKNHSAARVTFVTTTTAYLEPCAQHASPLLWPQQEMRLQKFPSRESISCAFSLPCPVLPLRDIHLCVCFMWRVSFVAVSELGNTRRTEQLQRRRRQA